eukprot:Em0002g1165a
MISIIHRAFGASRIPSRLEPSGISRSDGKRPDDATLVPWKCGKLLVWDATCVDTYAPSSSRVASQEAGAVADQAEKRKSDKYSNMDPNMYLFAPVVIETSGVFGKQTLSFLKDLACRVLETYGAWGKEATAIISSVASRLATSTCRPKSTILHEIYGQLNLNLVCANATAILSRIAPPP